MKSGKLLAFALIVASTVFVMFSGASSAQQVREGRRDSQAVALLQQCWVAMGSPGSDTTVSAVGRMTSPYPDDPVTAVRLMSKGYSNTRWELDGPAGQHTLLFNNGTGRSIRATTEKPIPTAQARYNRQEHFPALLCAGEGSRLGMDVVYVGLEKVGATPVHHVRVSAATQGQSKLADRIEEVISELDIFLDANSFVVLKTSRYAFSPDAIENRSLLETYYSNYKRVNGILAPFTITNFLAGQKLSDTNFDSVELNSPISDTVFTQK
jgi:hypothetical protein